MTEDPEDPAVAAWRGLLIELAAAGLAERQPDLADGRVQPRRIKFWLPRRNHRS